MHTMSTSARGPRKTPKVHTTSVRLEKDEHAKLIRLAAQERRSLSNQIRHLIAEADEREAA